MRSKKPIEWVVTKSRNLNGMNTLFTTERHFDWEKYIFNHGRMAFNSKSIYVLGDTGKRRPVTDYHYRYLHFVNQFSTLWRDLGGWRRGCPSIVRLKMLILIKHRTWILMRKYIDLNYLMFHWVLEIIAILTVGMRQKERENIFWLDLEWPYIFLNSSPKIINKPKKNL